MSEHGSFNLLGTFQNPDEAFAYLLQNKVDLLIIDESSMMKEIEKLNGELEAFKLSNSVPTLNIVEEVVSEEIK